jgi:hypothetical protein
MSIQTENLDRMIRLVEIALTIGRHLVVIMATFTAIMVAIAAYSFAIGNVAGGIVASLFALGGVILLVQIYQRRRRGYHRGEVRRRVTEQKYREVASA